MTDEQRRRWFALRAKLDTLLDRPVAPAPPRNPLAEDKLERWQRLKDASQEPPPAPERRKLDTFPVARVQEIVTAAIEDERAQISALLCEIIATQEEVNRALENGIDSQITKAVERLSLDLKGLERAVRDGNAVRRSASADNVSVLPPRPGVIRRRA